MANIGYARVSSREQHLDMQLTALMEKGCDIIFQEKVSGIRHRPELEKCLSYLRKGDTLVVFKFDRLGRSLKNLLDIFEDLRQRGISLISIQDGIDGSSATGKLMMSLMAALAEFERSVIAERCSAGRKEARLKGARFGRTPGIDKNKIDAVSALYKQGMSISSIMQQLGIKSKSTIYRYLQIRDIRLNRKVCLYHH